MRAQPRLSAPLTHCVRTCTQEKISQGWTTPHISFNFMNCPLCPALVSHPAFEEQLEPLCKLKESLRVCGWPCSVVMC